MYSDSVLDLTLNIALSTYTDYKDLLYFEQ